MYLTKREKKKFFTEVVNLPDEYNKEATYKCSIYISDDDETGVCYVQSTLVAMVVVKSVQNVLGVHVRILNEGCVYSTKIEKNELL